MAVTIREMRADDLEAVVGAVERAGVTVDRARIMHHLSLVACPDGDAQAAEDLSGSVLCVRGEGGGVALDVTFHATPADPALVRDLIDKALAKVQSAHIRACRVRIHGELPPDSDPLSTGNSWFDRFTRHRAA